MTTVAAGALLVLAAAYASAAGSKSDKSAKKDAVTLEQCQRWAADHKAWNGSKKGKGHEAHSKHAVCKALLAPPPPPPVEAAPLPPPM